MSMIKRRQLGFTLIEVIIFIVVVSAALAGILSVMNTVVKSSADPMISKQTMAIAESLLEEILLKEFVKPAGSAAVGFAASGARATFDCVDDYNTYATTGGVKDILGSPVAGLTNYNISPAVAVTIVTIAGQSMRQVVVSVTGPQGTVTLTGNRGNY